MPATLVADNISIVEQGARLVAALPPALFSTRSPATLNASIGGHLRHVIDHYACFLRGVNDGRVDYDDRERSAEIEAGPDAAVAALERIAAGLAALGGTALDAAMDIHLGTGAGPESVWARSTVGRELQFLLSHTVHHYALIAMVCRLHDHPVEPDFGVAPSTLEHRRRKAAACAR